MYMKYFIFITWIMSKFTETSGYMKNAQCVSHGGSNPSPKQLMNGTAERAWSVSLLTCAILCEKRSCISYSYDVTTQQCITRNVNTYLPGYLCGIAVDQARQKCQVKGETYIAFGGKFLTPMQCVCGAEKGPDWLTFSTTSSYDCIDKCTEPPCLLKLGLLEPCVICKGDETICNPTYNPRSVVVSICATMA